MTLLLSKLILPKLINDQTPLFILQPQSQAEELPRPRVTKALRRPNRQKYRSRPDAITVHYHPAMLNHRPRPSRRNTGCRENLPRALTKNRRYRTRAGLPNNGLWIPPLPMLSRRNRLMCPRNQGGQSLRTPARPRDRHRGHQNHKSKSHALLPPMRTSHRPQEINDTVLRDQMQLKRGWDWRWSSILINS